MIHVCTVLSWSPPGLSLTLQNAQMEILDRNTVYYVEQTWFSVM